MITLTNIHKHFGTHHVLKGIDLHVNQGEVVSILGPSGSGKSTLLRCINFLEQSTSGTIEIDGIEIDTATAKKKDIHTLTTATGMVFQQYNLFRNLTALQNVMIGLTNVKKMSKVEAKKVGEQRLDEVGLKKQMNHYPSQLSGGQQQRVGIARALALKPQVLLFDEPTSSLDPELVEEVLMIIKAIAKAGNTMIVVTHELNFAREISDKVIFMEDGVIIEAGTTDEIFLHPQADRTKQFISKII